MYIYSRKILYETINILIVNPNLLVLSLYNNIYYNVYIYKVLMGL